MTFAIRRLGLARTQRARTGSSDAPPPARRAATAERATLEERALDAAPAITRELLARRSDAIVPYERMHAALRDAGLVDPEALDTDKQLRDAYSEAIVALHATPYLNVFDVYEGGVMKYQLVRS